jgi:hypothetical protein
MVKYQFLNSRMMELGILKFLMLMEWVAMLLVGPLL